jgi:hypothetical protein
VRGDVVAIELDAVNDRHSEQSADPVFEVEAAGAERGKDGAILQATVSGDPTHQAPSGPAS